MSKDADLFSQVPVSELNDRMIRFRKQMDTSAPEWQFAVIFSKINLYYFTGTMQEGMLIIQKDGDAIFRVRRSYERAVSESAFPVIKPMDSFRDAAAEYKYIPNTVYLETEVVPLAFYQRFQKYFPFKEIKPLDIVVASIRAVKSPYELTLTELSGQKHGIVLENIVPGLLKEGMSELDLAGKLYDEMLKLGHHGVARFGMFDTEIGIGHIAFGESAIYPTSFNGPGGNYGMCPAVPILGNRRRKLKKGDLVFIDIGFGIEGYHTDKTCTYMFGKPQPEIVIKEHNKCLTIQDQLAAQLKPGAIPSEIYETTINSLDPEFIKNFMGYDKRQVKFLGHGVGLLIDEIPVIAKGFDEPLKENMVIALEPKKGIKDVGMVGIENTFIVTSKGGRCITGSSRGLIPVYKG
jgi:Xaa-Pro dipeptidase